ncbi:MAG: sigma 54-interacting transcriptional regulator, partial [Deltaproteobacteria bacterium]|nr:sigma 54-interacting transcriptional regulator [Deltaproteobacteria bacterium]
MDDKTFFREATLRICGDLEIETALWRCFLYLADYIPATEVYLCYYDPDLGTIRFYAMANKTGGKRLNVHIPLPIETRTLIEQNRLPDVVLVNEAEEHPITSQVKRILGFPDFSTILMVLEVGEMRIGRAAFPAIGKNRYTQEHLRMLSLLKEPFAIALSNSLRYQEVLDLKDLLADDNRYLRDELRRASGEDVVGADSGLKEVMEMVRQVAPLDSPVLLLGETGAGKEVIANA